MENVYLFNAIVKLVDFSYKLIPPGLACSIIVWSVSTQGPD